MTSTGIDPRTLRTAAYDRNAERGNDQAERCFLCAKAVKDFAEMTSTWTDGSVHTFTVARFYIEVVNGGDIATAKTTPEQQADAGYCGAFPVGSDCAKRARKAGAFVGEVAAS